MNNSCDKKEHTKLLKTIIDKEILEDRALSALTSETLQKLNISLERLPRKIRALLEQVSEEQVGLELLELDPISIYLYKSREISEKLEGEYELLKLRQKNIELQAKIDRNNQFLLDLQKDLANSRQNLLIQDPNPDNIQEFIRQIKQKLKAYEESHELIVNKYSILRVPESVLPKSIQAKVESLQALCKEAVTYRAQADDIILMRETKAMLTKLRK